MPAFVLVGPATAAAPGTTTTAEVRVRNVGAVVDRFAFEVLGDLAGCARMEPAELSLMPGDEATALLVVDVPATGMGAGDHPIAVRTTCETDGSHSVEESTVTIKGVGAFTLDITPKTIRARKRGKAYVEVANTGNGPVRATLSATDPDDLLAISFEPSTLMVEPGQSMLVELGVRSYEGSQLGGQRMPFSVMVTGADQPVTVDGTFEQAAKRRLPIFAIAAVVVVLGLIGAYLLTGSGDKDPTTGTGVQQIQLASGEIVNVQDGKVVDKEGKVVGDIPADAKPVDGGGAGGGAAGAAGAAGAGGGAAGAAGAPNGPSGVPSLEPTTTTAAPGSPTTTAGGASGAGGVVTPGSTSTTTGRSVGSQQTVGTVGAVQPAATTTTSTTSPPRTVGTASPCCRIEPAAASVSITDFQVSPAVSRAPTTATYSVAFKVNYKMDGTTSGVRYYQSSADGPPSSRANTVATVDGSNIHSTTPERFSGSYNSKLGFFCAVVVQDSKTGTAYSCVRMG